MSFKKKQPAPVVKLPEPPAPDTPVVEQLAPNQRRLISGNIRTEA